MDLKQRTESFAAGSWKHLRTKIGMDTAETITLDLATFVEADHFPKGFIPAGTLLGKIGASGKYGPYGGSAAEVQNVAVDGTSGTFTLSIEGDSTAAIAFNATAAAVQAALEALPGVDVGDVIVTGGPGNSGGTTPYVVTFVGKFAGQNVALMGDADSLAGGGADVIVTQATAGGSAVSDGREVARGILLDRIPVVATNKTGSVIGALQWQAHVDESELPIAPGTAGAVDTAAKVALGTNFRWS